MAILSGSSPIEHGDSMKCSLITKSTVLHKDKFDLIE